MGNTGGIDVELVEEFLARALRDKLSLNMLPSDRCLDAFFRENPLQASVASLLQAFLLVARALAVLPHNAVGALTPQRALHAKRALLTSLDSQKACCILLQLSTGKV
jgi:hypothetical protein